MRKELTVLILLALSFVAACGDAGSPEPERIRLATTTSTDNSGLLDEILPPFEKAEGIKVDRIAVGTGRALALARNGDADIILVHARSREDAFVAEGFGVDRRDIMWNDFVIVGPEEDPAGIKGSKSAADALKKIANAKAPFVSRGDDSGTHTRERSLWKAAGLTPSWDAYREAGQGMGACLTIADETKAYVLTDRGTYIAYARKTELVVHVEGDPGLRNPYGAILVNPEKHEGLNVTGARLLLEYLTSEECRKRIAEFRVDGQQLFHPHREQ